MICGSGKRYCVQKTTHLQQIAPLDVIECMGVLSRLYIGYGRVDTFHVYSCLSDLEITNKMGLVRYNQWDALERQ